MGSKPFGLAVAEFKGAMLLLKKGLEKNSATMITKWSRELRSAIYHVDGASKEQMHPVAIEYWERLYSNAIETALDLLDASNATKTMH